MTELRVLHLDSERGFGGGQRQLLFLFKELHEKKGVRQALAAKPDSAISKRANELAVPFFPLQQRNDIDIFSAIELKKIVTDFNPAIIHVHTGRSLGIAMLARTCLGLKSPPIIINTRRVAFPLTGWMAKKKLRLGADYHIAISSACRGQILSAGIAPDRVAIIPSGVELPAKLEKNKARKKLIQLTGFHENSLIIGACGNLLPVKRFDWLIEAVAKTAKNHPAENARLVIFGEGPCREILEETITRSGFGKKCFMAGHIENPEQFFEGLDIFAMTSETEGLGTSLIDAMARFVPLIGSNTTGIRDVIDDNVNGLLFDPASKNDLADKLTVLVEDKSLRDRLGAAGPVIACKEFDIHKIVENILAFYRNSIIVETV